MKTNHPLLTGFFRFLPGIALVALFFGSGPVLMVSCNNQPATDSVTTPVKGTASRADLLRIIEGGWVNNDYEDALQRVSSPMFAAEAGRPVQEMLFDLANMKGDTVLNSTGRLNYLDGERFDIILFDEGGKTKMKIYQGKDYVSSKPIYVDYSINGADTILLLVNPTSNQTTIYHREFRKAPMKNGVPENALEHFVNRALFEGEWKSADGQTVTFNANGTVSGWDKWTWFSVEIDKYGTEVQPDIMSAYNDKMGATYVYTIDNGRLSIYEYDSQSGDGNWTRGKMVAEFTRK